MSDRNDDFFDEEYNRKMSEQQQNASPQDVRKQNFESRVDAWQNSDFSSQSTQSSGRGSKVAVIAAVLAIVLAIGFLLGFLVGGNRSNEEKLLSEVISTLQNKYLNGEKLTEEEWIEIIGAGGTAMFQTVDDYGRLLTPQQAYDLLYEQPEESTADGYFGMGYQFVEGLGLYVSQVMTDSDAYGKLEYGDIIVSISDVTNVLLPKTIDLTTATQEEVTDFVNKAQRLSVGALRGGAVLPFVLTRGPVGNSNNVENFHFVEYYFGDSNTNVSTKNENGRSHNTKELRSLGSLPSDVGYIRLNEFSEFADGSAADSEMRTVLEKFRQSGRKNLVLDLKGNPGGYVDIAANIVGMLCKSDDPQFYSYDMLLAVTLIDRRGNETPYYSAPTFTCYDQFFSERTDGKKNVVVWTDGNSASASELLTAALLDYGMAVQMGTTTYGKGIAQTVEPLNYNGQITNAYGEQDTFYWCVYYTQSKFYSPLGVNKHGVGFTPASPYDNLTTYDQLIAATMSYWGL